MVNRTQQAGVVAAVQVARYLSAAVNDGQATHAYLFLGPVGSGKTEAAWTLAKALICAHGGSDDCDDCIRVDHRTHPDVHLLTPDGAQGYVVGQFVSKDGGHGLIHDVSLAPIRASHKVYIITNAEQFNESSANAFLKTLEEPVAGVTFILLGRLRSAIKETIVSRCQVINFRTIPIDEAEVMLMDMTEVSHADARIALAVTAGSALRAYEFSRSTERRVLRRTVLESLERLQANDDLDVLDAVRNITIALKEPLDNVRLEQEQYLAKYKDFIEGKRLTDLEKRQKRETRYREHELVDEALAAIRSWLRDVLLLRLGQPDHLVNYDFAHHIEQLSVRVDEQAVLAALKACDEADRHLRYNVGVQLTFEALFLQIREALR
jgi:DNA polymerase-3 subunit delta'